MCGRFLLTVDVEELLERYHAVKGWINNPWAPWSQEVFPSNTIPIIRSHGSRELVPMKWGFVSPYAKGLIINTRGETIDSKPMFRRPFRQKRCIVPANAFFEWRKAGGKNIKHKIYLKQQSIFSLAGIYDDFLDKDGNPFTAFSIVTTTPNEKVAQLHDRMPVILSKENEEAWLDPALQDYNYLKDLIRPYDDETMVMEQLV